MPVYRCRILISYGNSAVGYNYRYKNKYRHDKINLERKSEMKYCMLDKKT